LLKANCHLLVTKVIYSFTGFQAPSKRREHVSRNKDNWDPLKGPANLGMCKFTAVVKQVRPAGGS
jgi:hypothetical protein